LSYKNKYFIDKGTGMAHKRRKIDRILVVVAWVLIGIVPLLVDADDNGVVHNGVLGDVVDIGYVDTGFVAELATGDEGHSEVVASEDVVEPEDVQPANDVNNPSPPPPPVAPEILSALSVEGMHATVNEYRQSKGVAVLALNAELSSAATEKCNDMSARDYFSHTSPEGESPWKFVNDRGIKYTSIGENIAGGPRNANGVVEMWSNSSGHNKNMLNSSYNSVGYGVCSDLQGSSLIVQILARL